MQGPQIKGMLLLLLACHITHTHTQISTLTATPANDAPVCKTFIRIEDKSQTPSLLRVNSPIVVTEAFPVSAIVVRNIRLRHPRIGSLKVDLTVAPPSGAVLKRLTLKPLRAGGAGQDMYDTTFSEAKTAKRFPYSEAAAPFSGTYLPEIPLTTLMAGNGTSAGEGGSAGTWSLVVTDFGRREKNESRQIQLDRWTLILCSNATQTDTTAPMVIPPATAVLTPKGSAGMATTGLAPSAPSSGISQQGANTGVSGSTTTTAPTSTTPLTTTNLPMQTPLVVADPTTTIANTTAINQTANGASTTAAPGLTNTTVTNTTSTDSSNGASTMLPSTQTALINSTAAATDSAATTVMPATATVLPGTAAVLPGTAAVLPGTTTVLPGTTSSQTGLTGSTATTPQSSGVGGTSRVQQPATPAGGPATVNPSAGTKQAPGVKTLQGPADGATDTSENENYLFQLGSLDPSQFNFWELGSGSNLARMTGLNASDLGTGSNLFRLGNGLGRANGILDQMLGDYGLDRGAITSLLRDTNPLISAFSDDANGVNKTQQVETVVNLLTLGINALANQLGQNLADTALNAANLKEKYQSNTDNLNSLVKVVTFLPRAYRSTAQTYSQLLNDTGSVLNQVISNNAGLLSQLSSSLQILGSVLLNNLETNLNEYSTRMGGGASQLQGAFSQFKDLYSEYQKANEEVLDVAKSLVPETKTNFNQLQDALQGVLGQVGSIIGNATGLLKSSQTSVLQRYAETVGLLTEGLKKYVSSTPASTLLQGRNGQVLQYVNKMLQQVQDNSMQAPGFKTLWERFQAGSGRGGKGAAGNLVSWPNFTLLNMVKNIDSYLGTWYDVVGNRGIDGGFFG